MSQGGLRRGSMAHRVLSHMPLALYAAAAEEKCFQCQRHSRARIERSMRVLLMLPIASSPWQHSRHPHQASLSARHSSGTS